MTRVTVKNLGPGLRAFHNIDHASITIKPGDARTFDMNAHHVMQLERAAAKENPAVGVVMSQAERKSHDAELKQLRKGNQAARMVARNRQPGVQVHDARALPPTERRPQVDRRFLTDPQTVHPDRTADPAREDQGGGANPNPTNDTPPPQKGADAAEGADAGFESLPEDQPEQKKGKGGGKGGGKSEPRVPLKNA